MSDGILSKNEAEAKDYMPATPVEMADHLGCSKSYVYDIAEALRQKGFTVDQDESGRYRIVGGDEDTETESASLTDGNRRITSSAKGTITKRVRETLAEMEAELKGQLGGLEPARADGGFDYTSDGTDVIFHRTDDHFGEVDHNQYGETVYDSEVAQERVEHYFDTALEKVEARRQMGDQIDAAHLLLGGDMVTNESIYEGQAHDIDENLYQQIDRAAEVYIDAIRRLSNQFPAVQVVCQAGNHGELRASNASSAANADDILYLMLDKVVRESDMENVTFIQSDTTYYVDFEIRDWDAHLRHGHDASLEHIGTNSAKARWRSWVIDHGFDVAFRGHYHTLKEEPVNGIPVVMGGSITPQSDFEESNAMSGRAMGAVHGATDRYPLSWSERIHFGE